MDLFELSATLGLDTDPFTSALGSVKNIAMKALGELADLAIDFGKDVINTGMGFDKQMSAVQAVLGREEGTLENMNRLRAFALDQAEDSIFTAEQTAQAYYYMGMAGWKTEEMIAGLPGIMSLAAASGEDLGMVSDIVTDSLTAFGRAAGDASWYADILAQTATNSNTDVRRMGETFKYVAPIAGTLGIAVDDVALSIGLMANAGIKGSQAGTSLRQILTRIATNAGETKKDLGALTIVQDKLGVTVWDSAGNMRDFSDIIDECRVAWKKLTPEMQTYYAKQIGSQRGMPAWLAMMNAAEDDLDQLKEAFINARGAADYMADIKLDNLWGDIARFKSALDTTKIALFDDVKGPLRDVVQYGTDAIKRIHSAIDEGGLLGGIHQLGVEITDFGNEYKDEFAALAKAIVPVVQAVVNELVPAFAGAAVSLGEAFVDGIFNGIWNTLKGIFTGKDTVFNNTLSLWKHMIKNDDGIIGTMFGPMFGDKNSPGDEYELGADENGALAYVKKQSAVGDTSGGGAPNDFFTSIQDMFGWNNTGSSDTDYTIGLAPIKDDFTSAIADLGVESGQQFADGISAGLPSPDEILAMYPNAWDVVWNDIGTEGGTQIAQGITDNASSAAQELFSIWTQDSAAAGSEIGSQLSSGIQSELDATTFTVNVVGNYVGTNNAPGGAAPWQQEKFAKGMSGGYIMRGATIFGENAKGQPMVGGEAGNEAVVGTGSLNRMIQSSVNTAMNGLLNRLDAMVERMVGYEPRVYLDTGALVGGMVNGINSELNDITRWRGSGRT